MSTDVSEVHAASIIRAMIIALMMEAACTSETSVDIQLRTWQYIPEDSELHTRRRENFKSSIMIATRSFCFQQMSAYEVKAVKAVEVLSVPVTCASI
jgi:hypothetical protein